MSLMLLCCKVICRQPAKKCAAAPTCDMRGDMGAPGCRKSS